MDHATACVDRLHRDRGQVLAPGVFLQHVEFRDRGRAMVLAKCLNGSACSADKGSRDLHAGTCYFFDAGKPNRVIACAEERWIGEHETAGSRRRAGQMISGMVQTWRLSGRIPRPLRLHPAGAGVRPREGEEGVPFLACRTPAPAAQGGRGQQKCCPDMNHAPNRLMPRGPRSSDLFTNRASVHSSARRAVLRQKSCGSCCESPVMGNGQG